MSENNERAGRGWRYASACFMGAAAFAGIGIFFTHADLTNDRKIQASNGNAADEQYRSMLEQKVQDQEHVVFDLELATPPLLVAGAAAFFIGRMRSDNERILQQKRLTATEA